MKEEALALVANIDDPADKRNLLREYMQAFVMRSLHESEAFLSIAFVGGTALRFLKNLPRFSEDLDFSVVDAQTYAPEKWLKKLKTDLELAGFDAIIKWKDRNTVNAAWVRVSRLLHPAGIGTRVEQNLSIRLDLDTRPPAGAQVERSMISRHLTFAVCHYTPASLFAGKLHALVTRAFPKGRDWFDLLWFAGHKPLVEPNLSLLQNALDQTKGVGTMSAQHWPKYLRRKLNTLNIKQLAADVNPFLERPEDRLLISTENLKSALRVYG